MNKIQKVVDAHDLEKATREGWTVLRDVVHEELAPCSRYEVVVLPCSGQQ